jgi:3-deoxy-7-phosphoheptulonate synthase
MSNNQLNNIHIRGEQILVSPAQLKEEFPLSSQALAGITLARQTISRIIKGQDPRLLVICGPCSIHNPESALQYARQLKALSDELSGQLFIVMRVYFEKPRTTVGWKGLLNDPHLDGSFDIHTGLRMGRKLLAELAEIGLPVATEALDPIVPQYLADLFSWSAIGARTTESQTHREMASGLSMPVGFKNSTDGDLGVALSGMVSATAPHRFLGINQQGQVALQLTDGNPDAHLILRGGTRPNYDAPSVKTAEKAMEAAGVSGRIIIDCSHANSGKKYQQQVPVGHDVIGQIKEGNTSIMGLMLESHLREGNQKSDGSLDQLDPGISITDACINWQDTEAFLREAAQTLATIISPEEPSP